MWSHAFRGTMGVESGPCITTCKPPCVTGFLLSTRTRSQAGFSCLRSLFLIYLFDLNLFIWITSSPPEVNDLEDLNPLTIRLSPLSNDDRISFNYQHLFLPSRDHLRKDQIIDVSNHNNSQACYRNSIPLVAPFRIAEGRTGRRREKC